MQRKIEPSCQRLRELFDYRDGQLFWRERADRTPHWNKRFVGRRAGAQYPNGYRHVPIDSVNYMEHRMIWLWHGGETAELIDHRNGDVRDNRIENLRPATYSQNAANMKRPPKNTSGFKGVHLLRRTGRWQARIKVMSKLMHLGYFDTPAQAGAAYDAAARLHFGEYARREHEKE